MATANVEFYEKLKYLQEQKQESERRRLLLEQQLIMNASSDKKVHVLRVAQLQNYWRKLCEDEKRSQRRNEQLLRDLNRIDEHTARLAEKTEKLRTLKCEYEAYIEKTYPNWKEKVMSRQQQQRYVIPNEHQIYNEPRWNGLFQPVHPGLVQQSVHDGTVQQHPKTNGFIQQQPGSNGPTYSCPGPNEPVHPHPGPNGPAYPYPGPNGPAYPYLGANGPVHPLPGPYEPAHIHPGQTGPAQQHLEAKEQQERPSELQQQPKSGELQQNCERNGAESNDSYKNAHSLPYKEEPLAGSDGSRYYFTPGRKYVIDNQNPDKNHQPGRSESMQRKTDERRTSASDNHTKVYVESPVQGQASKDPFTRLLSASKDPDVGPTKNDTSKDPISVPAKGDASKDPISIPAKGDASKDPVSIPAKGDASKDPVAIPAKGNASKDPVSIPAKDHASKDPVAIPAKDHASKDPISVPAKDRASKDPAASPAKGPASRSSTKHHTSDSPLDSPLKQPDSSSPSADLGKGNVREPLATKEVNNIVASPEKKADGMNRAEPKEEIQTDRTYASEISDFEEVPDRNDNLSNCNDAIRMRHQGKSVSVPQPDVSLQGFCRMLKAVEDEVSHGRCPKVYFRIATPRTSVIQEIITNANRGRPLSHFNVDSIAMVILEQLPCLSMNTKNSCLLTDQILTSFHGEVSSEILRDQLDPSDHLLWESLYDHFIVFLQYKVLSVTEIAEIFAPLLLAGNSKLQKQAIVLVTKILEAVSEEELDMATPGSTSDFSFASAHPPTDGVVSQAALQSVKLSTDIYDQNQKVLAAAKAASPTSPSSSPHSTPFPGLPLGNSLSEDRLPISKDPQETLTQTAAYKQLLASTNMAHKQPDTESDEDDEIEKNLSQHFTNSGPLTVNKTSEENIKSPKSPDNLKSPKSPKSDSARSNFSDDSLKQEIDRKNSLALKSASLKSGRSAVESIISRVHDDFDLDEDDPPIPTSSLTKSKDYQVKERKDVEDDDDFWA